MQPEQTAKVLCGSKLRNGNSLCRRPAGWGTSHVGWGRCKLHGGNTRTQILHSAQLEAAAVSERVMGHPVVMEPDEALRYCISVTVGEIYWINRRIEALQVSDAVVPMASERHHEELDRDGNVHTLQENTRESTVLLHVWISTRQGAIDRLARYSKMALDAGVAERRVQISERQADMLAAVVLGVVDGLQLTEKQRQQVPVLLERHVGRFDEQAIEGTAVPA